MEHAIAVDGVSLKFRLYHDKGGTLKQSFASLLRRDTKRIYTDFWALKDINLRIVDGERVGIIGANGAGKSSLLKTICRIYAPETGEVRIQGSIAPLLEVGAGFHPELTGRENILLNGVILGQTPRRMAELEPAIIAFSGLEDFIDTPVKYYSTGMYLKARVHGGDFGARGYPGPGRTLCGRRRGVRRARHGTPAQADRRGAHHRLRIPPAPVPGVHLQPGAVAGARPCGADGTPREIIALYQERSRAAAAAR